MTLADLVRIRAAEELADAGSRDGAVAAVERQIASPESLRSERRFLRLVLAALTGA